jgi:DNA-binding transcriptional LysR family regulator
MELRRLRLLREVAERGSLTAAAGALSYSTSSVSEQIALLEREAGLTLLERGPRGVKLTEAGRLLAERADDILARVAAVRAELDDLAGLRAGHLRLGTFATAGATLVPRALAAFRGRHPGVEVDVVDADPDEAIALLAARELDVALVYEFEQEAGRLPRDLEQVHILDEVLRVSLPAGHRLAGRAEIDLKDLASDPWVQGVRTGSTANILPDACRAVGFEPRIAFRTNDPTAVQGFVAAGLGVAVMPLLLVPVARPDLVVRPLRPALGRRIGAALPPGGHRPPAAGALLEALAAVGAELAALS